jgi:hypothetical protein
MLIRSLTLFFCVRVFFIAIKLVSFYVGHSVFQLTRKILVIEGAKLDS